MTTDEKCYENRPGTPPTPPVAPLTDPDREARRILKERARLLARTTVTTGDNDKDLAVVVFTLGHEHYGVESHCVTEVVAVAGITPLPCTPGHVRGIVNLRGRIVTVIDLKDIFGLDLAAQQDHHRLIILNSPSMEFALLVDTVIGVENVVAGTLQPPPPTLTEIRADYMKGITEDQMAILDGPKLLGAPWLIVDETVTPM